jgi:hypothetical protein
MGCLGNNLCGLPSHCDSISQVNWFYRAESFIEIIYSFLFLNNLLESEPMFFFFKAIYDNLY